MEEINTRRILWLEVEVIESFVVVCAVLCVKVVVVLVVVVGMQSSVVSHALIDQLDLGCDVDSRACKGAI